MQCPAEPWSGSRSETAAQSAEGSEKPRDGETHLVALSVSQTCYSADLWRVGLAHGLFSPRPPHASLCAWLSHPTDWCLDIPLTSGMDSDTACCRPHCGVGWHQASLSCHPPPVGNHSPPGVRPRKKLLCANETLGLFVTQQTLTDTEACSSQRWGVP